MWAASCLIVSKPSLSLLVIILTEQSFCIEKLKSFNSPFTLIISACFESDLLIFSATSKPVTLFLKLNFFPSGKVISGIYFFCLISF